MSEDNAIDPHNLTRFKAEDIHRRGYKYTGVVLTSESGEVAIVDKAAVRWLSKDESWALMHPDSNQSTTLHGVNCKKVPHNEDGGYLHDENDDSPYSVDGMLYCGRCHKALDL